MSATTGPIGRRQRRAASALLVALVAGCGSLGGTAQDPARGVEPGAPPRALALLVGINRYAQPRLGTVPDLAGPEADVNRARQVLVERFGFPAADIRTLTGSDATHAGIVRAFHDHLIARAGKGTKVVFWFSGHGSRTFDLSGVESSKTEDIGDGAFDNTLIAYDSREQDFTGAYDITDDELHSLVRVLVQRTDQVLVVTDCCHSAGAVRGSGSGPEPGIRRVADGNRPLDADALAPFWPRPVPRFDDDEGDDSERLSYVHIAACAEHQEAGEIKVGEQSFGTLSWFLTEA
ncbi:MAG: caspase family protein, partial [Planctomycetota bacterium]